MSHKGNKHGRARSKMSRERRRKEAEQRSAACAELSPKERLELLDRRFGPGTGAKRERERMLAATKGPRRARVVAISEGGA